MINVVIFTQYLFIRQKTSIFIYTNLQFVQLKRLSIFVTSAREQSESISQSYGRKTSDGELSFYTWWKINKFGLSEIIQLETTIFVCAAMAKFRPRLKGKGKRWLKGHSSNSNPETTKHRDAAKSRFFQENLG